MKKNLLIIVTMMFVLALVGCGSPAAPEETKAAETTAAPEAAATTAAETTAAPEAAPEKLKITIGVDDAYPPMEFRNENNELVGFDVDFVKAVAEVMDIEFEYIPTAWDGIFAGLETEKYDCIVSAVSITPERLENYEFSKPYLSNGQVIVVRKGDASIATPEDLAGKKVGVQIETTADIAAKKHKETIDFELTQYDDIIQTFAELDTKRINAVVVDYAVAIDYVMKAEDKYEITSAQLTNEPIGVCFKKGNTELQAIFNEGIKKVQESGKMAEISKEWLGGDYVSDIDEELR